MSDKVEEEDKISKQESQDAEVEPLDIDIDLEALTSFSEETQKAFDAGPEVLVNLSHEKIMEELREKQKVIEAAFDKLIAVRDEIISKIREERAYRDEYNKKVKEIASKIRELNDKKAELQEYIDDKKQELNEMRKALREINERLETIQREIEGFSLRKERRIKAQIRKLEHILETFNIPPEIEERVVRKIKYLSDQLKGFKEKEEKWREMGRLKKERERLRDSIGALRKALVLYIQELRKIRSEIRELRKERDHYKSKADEHHNVVQSYGQRLEYVKSILEKLRELRRKVMRTLSKVRKLKQQMRYFKAEEEFKQVVLRRLSEIKTKIERGELEMPDLQFLINFGFLTEDIFEKIATSTPQELAKKVAEELGYK